VNESCRLAQFEGVLEEILNVRRASGVSHKGSISRFGELHEDIQMADAATGAVTLQVTNMLQCGVVCCACLLVRLQGVRWGAVTLSVLRCGAGCCRVLQCVAVECVCHSCIFAHDVAGVVCCSVMQCVAVD